MDHSPESKASSSPDAAGPVGARASQSPWHLLGPHGRDQEITTSEVLRDLLCHAEGISTDVAMNRVEAFARMTGLLEVDGRWFSTERHCVLPPISHEAYDRLRRALRRHIEDCDRERLRHGTLGNAGAARALASEAAQTDHLIRCIEALTQKPT